jgi:hypothetical protein
MKHMLGDGDIASVVESFPEVSSSNTTSAIPLKQLRSNRTNATLQPQPVASDVWVTALVNGDSLF